VTRASLYSYYRVDPARRDALRSAVEALFQAVAQAHGVQGRWMHRKDDPETFMEVYDNSEDVEALAAFIRQECERTGFRQLLADAGARHDEIFVDAD
jgi:quinol monooxygenase YgiN